MQNLGTHWELEEHVREPIESLGTMLRNKNGVCSHVEKQKLVSQHDPQALEPTLS
jgi:hypothetical protein